YSGSCVMLAIRAWFLNRTLTSKLVMIFALPFLFLVVVTTYALLTFQEFERAEELANHSSQIKSQAVYYRDLLNSIQSGFRGYLLTGDRSFLAPYDASKGKRDLLLKVIVGGTVLTLLLTGLGVIVVARSVTKPMSSLAKAALEIGESRFAVFPDADRQDEVGVLSRSMEEMQRRLVSAERL